MGVTVVPLLSIPRAELAASLDTAKRAKPKKNEETYVRYIPFSGEPPSRRVVLAWRRSFTRYEAIAALRNAVVGCELAGVKRLNA